MVGCEGVFLVIRVVFVNVLCAVMAMTSSAERASALRQVDRTCQDLFAYRYTHYFWSCRLTHLQNRTSSWISNDLEVYTES